ncbi:MAG: hypothetical protein JSV04_11105 [Candidatus Heimdallarchaeota archaeon]|nr:MAG: hypothetical protein JSV04_11105 [Candidatus Heimdallarchaeota archaeon]
MVSFDELETFLAFFVFQSSGKLLISKDFRSSEEVKSFPPAKIQSLLDSAYNISQSLDEESISEGQIFHVDFSSMRIAGIVRQEGLIFSLISSSSASLLDIEFKLRTLMTLFLGNFAEKITKKTIRLSGIDKEEFDEAIQTVMTGESRYMSESKKREVDEHLAAWVLSDDAVRGACISSFTGAIIVNRMDTDILPAAVRAIRGAFAAHLEKPTFFLAVSGVTNIFVYILGEGLLLLVDANPECSPATTVNLVEDKVMELRNLIL